MKSLKIFDFLKAWSIMDILNNKYFFPTEHYRYPKYLKRYGNVREKRMNIRYKIYQNENTYTSSEQNKIQWENIEVLARIDHIMHNGRPLYGPLVKISVSQSVSSEFAPEYERRCCFCEISRKSKVEMCFVLM